MMEPLHADLSDCGFEPQTRARSNTWPLPRPDNFVDIIKEEAEDDLMKSPCSGGMAPSMCVGPEGQLVAGPAGLSGVGLPAAAAAKKNSSRRNAWGNLSYADLITQAITTAPDKRLTLSQIYEWMVHNVPYFKDKGDSNSSAGWKNSIRHNLSLHNRFMRVQNEGTGKSSWWMINPDAKPGKSARRRATSMETSKFEKRRGRVKKKVEALRNGLVAADATPSPCSSVSEGLDLFPDSPIHSSGFQLSPDFRPRASSNASSCGRLSPIPAVEQDWGGYYSAEQLAGNLEQGMKLHQDMYTGYSAQHTAPPPPYQAPYESPFGGAGGRLSYGPTCPVHRMQGCTCSMRHCGTDSLSGSMSQSMSPGASMSPSYSQSEPSPNGRSGQPAAQPYQNQQQPASPDLPGPAATTVQGPGSAGSGSSGSPAGTPVGATTIMGQLMGALNPTILDDLNLNIETLPGGFDCNVDEVIKQELSLEGSLDFNFGQHAQHAHLQPLQQATSLSFASFQAMSGGPQGGAQHSGTAVGPQAVPPYTSVTSGHSWVH